MPEMDGYDLCKTLKNTHETKDIPVMLLTNLSDPHDVIKGLQSGADNFLTKPYNKDFLLSRIRYILVNQEIRLNSPVSNMGMEIVFGGKKYFINSDKIQIMICFYQHMKTQFKRTVNLRRLTSNSLGCTENLRRKTMNLKS